MAARHMQILMLVNAMVHAIEFCCPIAKIIRQHEALRELLQADC